MTNALVLDVPVKLGLELVSVVGSDLANAERELLDDVVNEVDCAGLGVFLVNLQSPHPCRVINGCELDATNLLSAIPF